VTVLVASVVLAPAASSTAATDTNVAIVYRAYQPSDLTVLAGQTVVWRNSGLGPHTVTSDAGQFDSGPLQAGASFASAFSTPGTYLYSCRIHPTMHGRVVVLAGLPPGFPPEASLNAVQVKLSKRRGPHASTTLVHALAARPGATRAVAGPREQRLVADNPSRAAELQRHGDIQPPRERPPRAARVSAGPAGDTPLTSKVVRPAS